MQLSDDMRRCLKELDVAGVRRLARHVWPHMPQPRDDAEALAMMHSARTAAQSIPLKQRAYSHRWLLDNGFPSSLPDRLKPSAERIYPKVVSAVGISVNFSGPILRPIGTLVRGAMEDAVLEAYADGRTDTPFLKARMREAKDATIRKLVGLAS